MISALFIQRPILASVLSIVIVIGGFVSMGGLPITQYPDIVPIQVTVSTSYPGADADTVANSVAAPLEKQINGVDNMLYMQSISSATGDMQLTVYFSMGTDPDTAEVQVNNRVGQALPELPDVVRNAGVQVQKRSSSFLMLIGIYSKDGRYDEQYVGNYANLYVLDALKRVPGANQASIMGLPDLAMRLWLKPDRMAGLKVTTTDIQNAVSQQNKQFGAGRLGQAPTSGPVEMTFPVVTEGRFSQPREFENIILRAEAQGTAIVRVKDVGYAEEGLKQYLLRSSLNGSPATFIAVYQQPGSNAMDVAKKVRAELEVLKQSFPDGIDYTVSLDTTKFVEASIDEVVTTLLIAVLLVVLVTYLFLQNINATLIPTVAIFVSVIGTFIGMGALGFSINLLTLFGLILAIGIVCDDAIVVVENVERNMNDLGMPPKEATLRAMEEVTGPVIATTLVLIAVFVPVAFLSGTTGVLYQQFAITIAISVAISSFVALTLTPALAAVLLKPRGKPRGLFKKFNDWLESVTNSYVKGAALMIKRSGVSLLALAVMLGAIVYLFKIVPGSFVPAEDQGFLFAAIVLPDGASLDRTEKLTNEVAQIFSEHPAVQDYSALSGYSLLDGQFKTNAGTVFVSLKDFSERGDPSLGADALLAWVAPRLAVLKDGVAFAINPPPIPGLGSQGGFEFWLQNRGQGGVDQLEKATRGLIAAADARPETTRLNSTINAASRQLRTDVDRSKAETLGVPVQDIYNSLQTLFGSLYVSQYNKFGRVWQVIMQAEPDYREKPEDINNIFVRQAQGEMVPLSALVSTSYGTGPDLVSRFNGFTAAKITGDAAPGFSSGQSISTMEDVFTQTLPGGNFTYAWAGQAYEEKKSGGDSAIIFVFALVMVFLILAAQYEQWSLPIAVLTAVPFGIFGALVAVFLRGMENDVYFQIGLVTLIGLSTKNAILIVEFAELKYGEGSSPMDAALEAARLRLRPILMTSLSFILGSMPLVLASGAGAAARHSIGTGIIGGMIGATSLALFFVPLFYFLIISAKERIARGKKKTAAAEQTAPEAEF